MRLTLRFLAIPLLFAGLFPTFALQAATPTVTTLARLGGTPDGYHPASALVAGGDGALYGTTEAGGPANCGTVYKITPDGTFATLYSFTGGSDGANPEAALVDGGDGFFYGTTTTGGTGGNGTVFKISRAGAFTGLYSFSGFNASFQNADGAAPQAALVVGGDGFFYGTASKGGAAADGTIFRITPAGVLNTVYSFSKYSDGTFPQAALTPGGDGYFYGTTSSGGTSGGTIFRVTSAGTYQVLYNFTSGADGGNSKSALVLSGGQFYGLTNKTFFSVTTAGALTTLHTFTSAEGNPVYGGLIAGPGGTFYGTAAEGGVANAGSVFAVTPTGAVSVVYSFQGSADGASPATPPVLGGDGNLYGVNSNGFNGNFSSGGVVYQLTPAGALTTLHAFTAGGSYVAAGLIQYADGNFYGLTQQGGAKNGGAFFGLAPGSADVVTLREFDPDAEGSHPVAGLVQASDGSLYGSLAADGPDGGGTIFQMAPGAVTNAVARGRSVDGQHPKFTLDPIHPFDPFGFILNLFCNTGEYPGPGDNAISANNHAAVRAAEGPVAQTIYGSIAPVGIVFGSSGVLYGILQEGGDGSGGGIFSHAPGSLPTVVHSFGVTAGDGILPEGLVAGTDGNFYGTTYGGGTATVGTIFKYGADGTYAVLYSFQGTGDGAYPQTGLTAGSDGNLYGVTQHASYGNSTGFTGAPGTIFSITPSGTFRTLHTFATDDSEGTAPTGALLQASDGNFYGTTQDGVLFSITPGGQFTVLYRYKYGTNGANLSGVVGPLIQATDGNLYGTTTSGGTDNAGVVFKVALNPTTPPTGGVPVVTLSSAVPEFAVDGGQVGAFLLTLSSAPATDIKVAYTVKGSATPGVDYVMLKGTAKVKAGKTTKVIKVTPEGNLNGASKKVVKLTLAPGTGYTVGTTTFEKVKILPAGQ